MVHSGPVKLLLPRVRVRLLRQHPGRRSRFAMRLFSSVNGETYSYRTPSIQRQISAHLPFILHIQIPIVPVKMVVVLSKLHRCLLRKAEQKVGEIIARARNLGPSDYL